MSTVQEATLIASNQCNKLTGCSNGVYDTSFAVVNPTNIVADTYLGNQYYQMTQRNANDAFYTERGKLIG